MNYGVITLTNTVLSSSFFRVTIAVARGDKGAFYPKFLAYLVIL